MTSPSSTPPRVFLAAKQEEGPLSLETAYREHASYLASLALRILGEKNEVQDIVHDAFLSAAKSLHQLREPAALRGWLARITVRLASKKLRRRRFGYLLGAHRGIDYSDIAAQAENPADRALVARIYRALDALPVDQRVAWTLRYLEGERLDRVAVLCNCSLATAKRRIAAAHEAVKRTVDHG